MHKAATISAVLGLAAFAALLLAETAAYRRAVLAWAGRDLEARVQLAAEALGEAPATGDFAAIRAFGDECRANGLRFTLYSPPGGVMFDTLGTDGRDLSAVRVLRDGHRVRLARPLDRVLEPSRRTRVGLALAGLAGASGLLVVFLVLLRLQRRNRALALEQERQAALLAEMRRVEAFRRDFIADVSHEIKTPLTGILGAVDLLPGAGATERDALLGMLRTEAKRLNALARNILALARLEQAEGTAAPAFAPADLTELARGVAARFEAQARAAGVVLSVEGADGPTADCAAESLDRALANLVENALRYSGSPTVVLSVARDGDAAVLAVTDRGRGIAAEHLPRLFERFYRAEPDRARETGGSGLGLAIVRGVAQVHGGTVRVASEPGRGARFEIRLPLKRNNNANGKEN